ncbi:glycosyltransferase, partial [Schleiferiaceae bacterium]|nr:glycosyltransferase [Schleiferiaceae bacterium]
VKKYRLQKNVRFLGNLTELQMKKEFLNAHIYVMPSAIENSPNSLCEAQILGVPVVASYCGGTPSLVNEGITGYLYRYEDTEVLSSIILRLFAQEDLTKLSCNEKRVALERHNRRTNALRLLEIYNQILGRC